MTELHLTLFCCYACCYLHNIEEFAALKHSSEIARFSFFSEFAKFLILHICETAMTSICLAVKVVNYEINCDFFQCFDEE